MKVLVIDDSNENLDAAKKFFDSIDIELETATNATEGMQKISKDFLLIITDMDMSGDKQAGMAIVNHIASRLAEESFLFFPACVFTTGENHGGPYTNLFLIDTDGIDKKHDAIPGNKKDQATWRNMWQHVSSSHTFKAKKCYLER